MSKELEALNGLFDLIHCQESFEKAQKYFDIIEEALQRLESIDNAEPSEALECLEDIYRNGVFISEVSFEKQHPTNISPETNKSISVQCDTIKQALINAQREHKALDLLMQELDCKDFAELRKYARCGYEKINKKYLKWEDLEFEHNPKIIDVKMSGNKYKLVVGYNVVGKNLAILRDGKKEYYFLECDKQFFNDLHLERVEE